MARVEGWFSGIAHTCAQVVIAGKNGDGYLDGLYWGYVTLVCACGGCKHLRKIFIFLVLRSKELLEVTDTRIQMELSASTFGMDLNHQRKTTNCGVGQGRRWSMIPDDRFVRTSLMLSMGALKGFLNFAHQNTKHLPIPKRWVQRLTRIGHDTWKSTTTRVDI